MDFGSLGMVDIILLLVASAFVIRMLIGISILFGYNPPPSSPWWIPFTPPRWLVVIPLILIVYVACSIFFDFPMYDMFPPQGEVVG